MYYFMEIQLHGATEKQVGCVPPVCQLYVLRPPDVSTRGVGAGGLGSSSEQI